MTVLRKYLHNDRHYHTFAHIGHMIENLKTNFADYEDNLVLKYAIAYHDCVYDIGKPKGFVERESAREARKELQNDFNEKDMDEIERLIHLTIDHTTTQDDVIGSIMIDLDLAGLSTDMYEQNKIWVRQEFKDVPLDLWIEGRKKFLVSFLSRPYIYMTEYGYENWENKARENMFIELSELEGKYL